MEQKLFMVVTGCRPKDRNIEQHDVFFGIGTCLEDLIPAIKASWSNGTVHIDSWREVCFINGYKVLVKPRVEAPDTADPARKLYFINLGGYKPEDLEEYHYKIIVAAADKGEAVRISKQTAFYKHTGFRGATSHIDDKYGIDVDDTYEITDLLSEQDKAAYCIQLVPEDGVDELHVGYLKL